MSQISLRTAQKIAAAWDVSSSLSEAMQKAGIKTKDRRNLHRYRRYTEEMLGITLTTHGPRIKHQVATNFPRTTEVIDSEDKITAIVFSDGHFWPGKLSPAFSILLQVIKDINPDLIIDNGDSFDGATVSRHPSVSMAEDLPTVADEIEACEYAFGLIEEAAGPETRLLRNLGNHDIRYESYLSANAGMLRGVKGTTFSELFPHWEHNISVVLNGHTVIKHRFKGGKHTGYNNAVAAMCSIVTGHTHRLTCRRVDSYIGHIYGIETGTIADIGDQFAYTEHNPLDWQPGFAVLTVDRGKLYPELIEVIDRKAIFRGKEYFA